MTTALRAALADILPSIAARERTEPEVFPRLRARIGSSGATPVAAE